MGGRRLDREVQMQINARSLGPEGRTRSTVTATATRGEVKTRKAYASAASLSSNSKRS